MQPQSLRAFLIIYQPERKEETKPLFFGENNTYKTEREYVQFFDINNLENLQWNQKVSEIKEFFKDREFHIMIMAHDLKRNAEALAKEIRNTTQVRTFIDYSRVDPKYYEIWRSIVEVTDIDQLIRILDYWIQRYTVDPLRRIKHRAINLFGPLGTDLQYLLELLEQNKRSEANNLLEELGNEWMGDGLKSPCYSLVCLWYMLVGDALCWTKLGIEPPRDSVSLPKRLNQEWCVYEWLTDTRSKESIQRMRPWQVLLQRVQLCYEASTSKFHVKTGNGIYQFAKVIQENVHDLQAIIVDRKVNGFGDQNGFTKEIEEFHSWLDKLNQAFEDLIKEWEDS